MGYVSTKALAEALGLSRKGVLEKAKAEGWLLKKDSRGKVFNEETLPIDVRRRLFEIKKVSSAPVQIQERQ